MASNGTIYLPSGHASNTGRKRFGSALFGRPEEDERNTDELIAIQIPPEEMTQERVEAIASEHFGRPVCLTEQGVQKKRLKSIKEFFPAARAMFGNRSATASV